MLRLFGIIKEKTKDRRQKICFKTGKKEKNMEVQHLNRNFKIKQIFETNKGKHFILSLNSTSFFPKMAL